MLRRFIAFLTLCAGALALLSLAGGSALAGGGKGKGDEKKLDKIKHIVVIYEENHSFDNLYGGWEGVSTRIDEGSEYLATRLGLSAEQFCQVVLLPQGDFARFLRAEPEE